MTTRVLIVDPDISFTVPIKRALEQSGDFAVSVFANGQAAVESAQRAAYDVAILDFEIGDVDLHGLIRELRQIQAGLFVLVSPRTGEHVAQLPTLDVQGSITKPYFARQLIPVMREALAAKARLAQKEQERRLDAVEASPALSPDKPAGIVEPAIQPDDTFNRLVREETAQSRAIQPADSVPAEPPIPENATIGDLVSGQPVKGAPPVPPDAVPEMESAPAEPEAPADEVPNLAAAALGAAEDDTVPLDRLASQTLAAKAAQEAATPVQPPSWAQQPIQDADQPTLVEPSVTREDTQPSRHIPVQRWSAPAGDTEPGGGVVQKRLESDKQSGGPVPAPDVPPMLDEPSFVAQVVEETPPEVPSMPPSAPTPTTTTELEPASMEEPAPPPTPAAMPTAVPAVQAADPVANLAVQLTQLSVGSSAQVTVLTRGGDLLASAGEMPPIAVAGVVVSINQAWQSATDDGNALVRFINIPGIGDYLLYSTRTVESMTLSMLFPAETPLRVIRQQAKQLLKALENVPERPALPAEPSAESQAATTLPSRPTDLRPPEGLREATPGVGPVAGEEAAPSPAEQPAPPRAEGPYSGYGFVWLPREPVIPDSVANMVVDWMTSVAAMHMWQIDGSEVQPAYVTVQISIPANETPSAAVEALMRETAVRANDPALWADAYYIVSPGRAVTQQEIANFMEYRRDAQDAA